MRRRAALSLAAVLAIGACSEQQDSSPTAPAETPSEAVSKTAPSYVISFSAKETGDVRAVIGRAGGTVGYLSRRAGLATARAADPAFAGKLKAARGIRAVAMDRVVQWVDPNERVQQASIGTNEAFFAAQWAPRSIHAEEAWDDRARGTGARVAVLDGGLNDNHIDLSRSVDVARSRSFVPGFQFNQDAPCGAASCFSHATHVAGIVAAEDDKVGTIGVAPGATIIGVKVLHGGTGSFGAIIMGIVFATGTSMSTPAVAGVAALVVGTKGPMDADDLLAVLVTSADDFGAPGFDPVHGNGRVNAFQAVQ